jgi:alpha/beta hydrolase fold
MNEGKLAAVNGLEMYYEINGEGEPLILLHGGVGAIEMFGEVLPLLAEGRRVIAVDLQAHGRTADIDRPMTFEAMADDVAALIEHLGLGRADVMGYSLGGRVALRYRAGVLSCAREIASFTPTLSTRAVWRRSVVLTTYSTRRRSVGRRTGRSPKDGRRTRVAPSPTSHRRLIVNGE